MSKLLIATEDCTDFQLVAAWNILMFSLRTLGSKDDLPGRIAEVKAELDKRGIPNEKGKRIKLKDSVVKGISHGEGV